MNRTQLVHCKIQTVHCQISTVNVDPIRSDQAPGNVPTPHYSKPSADPLSVNAGPTEDPTQQYDLIRPQIPPRRRRPPSSPPLPKKKKEKEKVESFGHGGRGEERTFDPPLNAANLASPSPHLSSFLRRKPPFLTARLVVIRAQSGDLIWRWSLSGADREVRLLSSDFGLEAAGSGCWCWFLPVMVPFASPVERPRAGSELLLIRPAIVCRATDGVLNLICVARFRIYRF